MAENNWRENTESSASRPPKQGKPETSTGQPVQLGPIVRASSLVLIAIALVFLLIRGWKEITPDKKTTLYCLNTTETEFKASPFSTGLYLDEALGLFPLDSANLQKNDSLEEKTTALGPQKNTVLFYLYGDLSADQNGQLLISKNRKSGNRYDDVWMSLRDQLTAICGASIASGDEKLNRIVFVDFGQIDPQLLATGLPISEQIKQTLFSMKSEVANSDNLWVIISADEKQTSWYAPELGTSLFSFFVAHGLAGWAGDERPEISLEQLFGYVENSVAHWARDFRDSTQTPQLISLNELSKADEISAIYANHNLAKSPVINSQDYQKPELDRLWQRLSEARRVRAPAPHQMAMIESRLIRLEEARYSTSADRRSGRVFDKLVLEIGNLLDSLPPPSGAVNGQVFSLEQLPNAGRTDRSLQSIFRGFLFPPAGAPTGDRDSDPEPTGSEEGSDATSPAAAAGVPEIPESLKKLDKTNRIKLVWQYLCSPQALEDPLSSTNFAKSLEYIQNGRGDSGPALDGRIVPLVELQYLQIMNRNFSNPEQEESFAQQKKAILTAIRCRHMSESIIQGSIFDSSFDANLRIRTWPYLRTAFKQLEERRRHSEDSLWANDMEIAEAELTKLRNDYETFIVDFKTRARLQSTALQAIRITPHLRNFLTHEATVRETSTTIETELARINDVERVAIATLTGIQADALNSAERSNNLTQLRDDLGVLAQFFRNTYERHLLAPQSASEPVFHGMNFLASPIPEWLATNGQSKRSSIRSNVDDWIENQRTKFVSEWETNSRAEDAQRNELPPARKMLASNDFRRLVLKAPKYSFNKLHDVESATFVSAGQYLNQLKPGTPIFQDNFDYKNRSIPSLQSLRELQAEFAGLDLELNVQSRLLSFTSRPLDVGPQLSVLDSLTINHDKLERALWDCWGGGNVEELVKRVIAPPFVDYVTAYRNELETDLARLEKFNSRSNPEEPEYRAAGLRQAFDEEVATGQRIWRQLQATVIAWPNQPPTFLEGETVELKTELTTGLVLSEICDDETLDDETLKMGLKWTVNGRQLGSIRPFEFAAPRSPTPTEMVPSSLLLRQNVLEAIVGLRGHQFVQPFRIREGKPPVVETIVYRSIHRKPSPGPSHIQVVNGDEYRADIVFILDCSKSMENEVEGLIDERGEKIKANRFVFAKEALKTAIRKLSRENRFRFGLYAFGHRVEFGKYNEKTQRYEVSSNKFHPFDDSEGIFRLRDNAGGDVADAGDIRKIIGHIDQIESTKGITPLYYSIKQAALNEFFETDSDRPRYIVALTDGINRQINTSTEPLASIPKGRTAADATQPDEVYDINSEKNISLIVARITKTGAVGGRENKELEEAGAQVLPVVEDNSAKISEAILNAIGRNEYSLTAKDGAAGKRNKISPRDSTSTKEAGDFVVETFGVDQPSRFEIALEGDETVFLENTRQGLKLKDADPRFLADALNTNGKIKTGFGIGIYDVGRIKPSSGNELAFGFYKTNNANETSQNFSFRPQRVWAQVKDRNSGMTTNLFLPTFDPGRFPVARFELPQALLDQSESLDVVLWVTPNERDEWPAVKQAPNEFRIPPGESRIGGLDCNRQENEAAQLHTIEITLNGDPRGYFVEGAFDMFTNETTHKNGVRTKDIYHYQVARNEANFWLRILPREEYQTVIQRVNESNKRVNNETDPIFGDRSVWFKFQNIKIK